jgi:aldose 1-epimerase
MPAHTTIRFQDQDLIRVGDANDYLLLAPQHGGRLLRWVHRGEDILYWPEQADWTQPARIRGGNPLLFPFIARHFVDGEIAKWRDADGTIRTMPVHGFARDLPFEVVPQAQDNAITMRLQAGAATRMAYPFEFEFEVTYRLLGNGLEATLAVTNGAAESEQDLLPEARPSNALPYYAGHHFYFALAHDARARTTLAMPPATLARQRPDGSIEDMDTGDASYTLDDRRLQDTFHVLQGTGDSPCTLTMPPNSAAPAGRRIRIALDQGDDGLAWHAVTTWSEKDSSDFYCVEPWLGLPNAIHHGRGLRWLQPGHRETAVCRILVGE